MDFVVASCEQVIEWSEARPEFKEMLIEDMRKIIYCDIHRHQIEPI